MKTRLIVLCISLLATSCAIRTEKESASGATPKHKTAEEAAAALGNPLLANKEDINAINYNVSTSEELEKIDNGSDEELIWTNPDDPNAEIPGLNEAFRNQRLGQGWQSDMTRAIRLSRRQELPLIVWFHNSVISPKSNALSSAYLDTKEFDNWCKDRVVRLRLDAGVSMNDATSDKAQYHYRDINALQRRYGLTKTPSFAIISPSGKIVSRINGFDGFLNSFIADLEDGVKQAEAEHKQHKNHLRSLGYREWTSSRSNEKIFAKLLRYDEDKKLVYLKESGGRVSRTKLASFSQEDADFILAQPTKKPGKKKKHE